MPNSLYSSDSFNLKSVKSHAQLTQTANNVRIISQNLSNATIKLNIKTIMVVTKPGDDHLIALTNTLLLWLLSNYPYLVVYVDRHLQKNLDVNLSGIHERQNGAEGGSQKDVQKNSQKDMVSEQLSSEKQRKHRSNSRIKFWTAKNFEEDENYSDIFDLIITLGGDGTVLFVSQLFQNIVPPTIAFSLGSLGFLTNFKFKNYRKILTKILRLKYVKTNLRLRLSCQIVEARTEKVVVSKNVLNEITIDRGPNPFLTNLAVYGNDSLITITQADGLCIATPTGSTAYSLAAGGSLVHPSVSAISVTPICPHTLSFRPIILPDSMELKVTIPAESRCQASWVSFDGKTRFELNKDYYVVISASEFYFPTVMNGNNEYFDSVSNNLNWNTRKLQKPLNFHDNYKTCKPSKRDDDPVTQPKKTPSPNGVPKGRGTTPGKASHVYLGFAKSSDEESDSNQHDDDAFDDDDGFGTQSFYAQGDASDTEGLSSSTHQQDGESSHESSHDDTDDDDDVEEEEEEEEHHTFEDDDDDFIETPVIPFEDINEALEIFSDDEPHDNSHIQLPLPNNKSRSGSVGSFKKIRTNSFTNFNQVYRDKLQLDPAKLHNKINHLKINSSSGTNLGRASFKVSPSPVNTNFNSTNKLSNEKSSDSLSNTAPLKQALASTLPYPRRHQHSSLNNETTAPKSSPQEHRKQAGESIFELKSSVSNSSNESL